MHSFEIDYSTAETDSKAHVEKPCVIPKEVGKHGSHGSKGSDELQGLRPHWSSLFIFTTKAHIFTLLAALVVSIISGLIIPTLALFLGMIFNSFTEYGTGSITGDKLLASVSRNVTYLAILASANYVLSSGYFILWLIFGELQAKSAHDKVYNDMLRKEMEWFDMRKAGVSALMPRLQTFAYPTKGQTDADFP